MKGMYLTECNYSPNLTAVEVSEADVSLTGVMDVIDDVLPPISTVPPTPTPHLMSASDTSTAAVVLMLEAEDAETTDIVADDVGGVTLAVGCEIMSVVVVVADGCEALGTLLLPRCCCC